MCEREDGIYPCTPKVDIAVRERIDDEPEDFMGFPVQKQHGQGAAGMYPSQKPSMLGSQPSTNGDTMGP